MQHPMGLGGKPAKYWITLRNWRKLLTKIINLNKFTYIKKKRGIII